MEVTEIKYFIEAALLAAGRPLSLDQLVGLFEDASAPEKAQVREAVAALQEEYAARGIEVAEVASGYRMQVKSGMAERLGRLWEERPPRYSRALFETLALIAYRQPMTRGEIEEVRGVAVSANIVRTLLEREWVRVVGHRDVPGRPAMFGTTRQFLDYFGLKKLDDLPPLADLADWESLRVQLNLPAVEDDEQGSDVDAANEAHADDAVVMQLSAAGPGDDPEAAAEAGSEADSQANEAVTDAAPAEATVDAPEASDTEDEDNAAGDEAQASDADDNTASDDIARGNSARNG